MKKILLELITKNKIALVNGVPECPKQLRHNYLGKAIKVDDEALVVLCLVVIG